MRNVVQMCLAVKKISHAWNHAFLLLAIVLAWKWQLPEGIYQKTNLNGRAGHWGGSEVITTNNNLLFHFIGYNNDLLVLNQWKGALNRIMPSLLSLLKINVRACTYLGGPIWYNGLGVGAYLGDSAYLRKDRILYVCFSEVSYRSETMLDLYIAAIPDKRL